MRKQPVIAAAAAAVVSLLSMSVKADISGFSGFAPVNSTGATSVGYSTDGSTFTVTDGNQGESASGFYPTAQNITAFTSTFTYTVPGGNGQNPQFAQADGFEFVIQNDPAGTAALGGGGGSKGYTGIANSAALGVELYGGTTVNITAGANETDNGNIFAVNNGDPVQVRTSYSGTTLSISFYDPVTKSASLTTQNNVNLATVVGSSTALIGITGATGGAAATQAVSNFTFKSTAGQVFSPIGLASSSFNQDMVIEKTAPTSGALANITATMDNGVAKTGATYYETGYDTANTGTTGLPASGSTFVSQADANHTFQMQSYAGNNALLLSSNSPTGTVTFSTPKTYSALSFLTATGNGDNGSGPFSVTINYADGAASTTVPYELISPDWFFNGPVAWDANGRAYADSSAATTYDNVNNNEPNLYQVDLQLTDTTDPIASLTLTYGDSSTSSQVAVYAVSGAPVSAVPEPASIGLLAVAAAGLLGRRRRSN